MPRVSARLYSRKISAVCQPPLGQFFIAFSRRTRSMILRANADFESSAIWTVRVRGADFQVFRASPPLAGRSGDWSKPSPEAVPTSRDESASDRCLRKDIVPAGRRSNRKSRRCRRSGRALRRRSPPFLPHASRRHSRSGQAPGRVRPAACGRESRARLLCARGHRPPSQWRNRVRIGA